MSIRHFFAKLFGGPANVKLNLARAYLDMGDKEPACKLLRDVALEGTEAEKREAERLLQADGPSDRR